MYGTRSPFELQRPVGLLQSAGRGKIDAPIRSHRSNVAARSGEMPVMILILFAHVGAVSIQFSTSDRRNIGPHFAVLLVVPKFSIGDARAQRVHRPARIERCQALE